MNAVIAGGLCCGECGAVMDRSELCEWDAPITETAIACQNSRCAEYGIEYEMPRITLIAAIRPAK